MPSAREVDQFVYCAHNWYLARHGVEGKNGEGHDHLLNLVRMASVQEKRGAQALVWAVVLLAAASVSLMALLLVPAQDREMTGLVGAVTLAFLNGSLATFLLSQIRQDRAAKSRKNTLAALPLQPQEQELHDAEWGLSGKLQFCLQTTAGLVPVLIKTGHTPKEPYRSHRIQMGAYLRLLEKNGERRPAYGLVVYPGGMFAVAWDGALEGELKATLDKMSKAQMDGKADRDHESRGRCAGCARRNACEQRLG